MTRPPQKPNADRALRKLGEISFLGVPKNEGYALAVNISFGCPEFEWGQYTAQIGLTYAALALDHPGYDASEFYQAYLTSSDWSEKAQETTDSKRNIGGRIWLSLRSRLAGVQAEAGASTSKATSTVSHAKAEYPLVSRQPGRWIIGTKSDGDPRQPHGSELGQSLSGAYLDGDRGARVVAADYSLGGKKRKALCVLTPKVGANDPVVRAFLIAPVDALQIRVESRSNSSAQSSLEKDISLANKKERELKLRAAVAQACLEKMKAMPSEIQEAHFLLGELPIAEVEKSLQLRKPHQNTEITPATQSPEDKEI